MSYAEYRDPGAELKRFQLRLGVAGAAVLAAFALLFGRFVYLQLVQHDYYQTKAEDNRISVVPVVPNRGLITDRNGVVLARNESQYTLEINPQKVANLEQTIAELATVIDVQAVRPPQAARFLPDQHATLAVTKPADEDRGHAGEAQLSRLACPRRKQDDLLGGLDRGPAAVR